MTSIPEAPPAVLAAQLRHQVRVTRQRFTLWIPAIFGVGLGVSALGLVPSIAISAQRGAPTPGLFLFGSFVLFFGWAVFQLLAWPWMLQPRIVPYFARELAPRGGATTAAFARGRDLYLDFAALERLAATLGVTPLSTFGFAYDYFEQEVRWHPSARGLETAEALRRGLAAESAATASTALDLEALAAVLKEAASRGVEFSLVLRLHRRDSLQGVMTREQRQGSFW